MSHTLKYVGKPSPYTGKTLWEILGNLKDFGVGRIIVRNSQIERYPEPSYFKILEVRAQPNYIPPKIKVFRPPNDLRDQDRARMVIAKCEFVFRGVKYERPYRIGGESKYPDFSLVPKHLESNYKFTKTANQKIEENIYPNHVEFPPFLKEMLINRGVDNPKLKVNIVNHSKKLYRLAKDGETPTKSFAIGIDTSKSPLYKYVNYDI